MASADVQSILPTPQGYSYPAHLSTATTTPATKVGKGRNIETTLNYFKPNEDGSPPAPTYVGKPESYERPVDERSVIVQDIRGFPEGTFTLDTAGFQIVKHASQEKDFDDDERIKDVYYKETEELLKKATGASKVHIFNHTVRRQPKDNGGAVNAADALRGPVRRVHIDQSYSASLSRVAHHLPEEAEHLLKGRVELINVWRPIRTIRKDPLGYADAHSVSDDELQPIGLIYPDRNGETYAVKYKEGHKWYYLDQQTPEEVTLIKCFDTKTDGRARRIPHTAFVDAERENEYKRESIEIRALVFHEDDRD